MDRCEEDVIIAYGLYLLAEEEKRKKEMKTLDSMTNVARFHTGHLHLRLVCFW
jgi:hypothetical protein